MVGFSLWLCSQDIMTAFSPSEYYKSFAYKKKKKKKKRLTSEGNGHPGPSPFPSYAFGLMNLVIHLSYKQTDKLWHYTRFSSPEKSRNNAREKILYLKYYI